MVLYYDFLIYVLKKIGYLRFRLRVWGFRYVVQLRV